MSDDRLSVFEDPGHPEGGHALILFEGITARPQDARFQVESLEEGVHAWPEHLQEPVSVAVTERGLEIAAGPEIGNAILEGTPVAVAVPAAGLRGEILWPVITPLALGRAGRGGVHAGARRRVVAADTQISRRPVAEEPAKREEAPALDRQEPTAPPKPAPTVIPPSEEAAAGRSAGKAAPAGRRLALVAATAFLAGVGLVLAYAAAGGPWPFRQSEPKPVLAAVPPLPSLYDALVLPPASPRGLRPDGKPAPDAFAKARAAWGTGSQPQDGPEAAYWLRAIVRDSMPDNLSKSFSALGHLSLHGDGMARDPALATLFWELAAIGGRCNAFAALADEIEPPDKWRAIRWHGIAEQKRCPEPRKR